MFPAVVTYVPLDDDDILSYVKMLFSNIKSNILPTHSNIPALISLVSLTQKQKVLYSHDPLPSDHLACSPITLPTTPSCLPPNLVIHSLPRLLKCLAWDCWSALHNSLASPFNTAMFVLHSMTMSYVEAGDRWAGPGLVSTVLIFLQQLGLWVCDREAYSIPPNILLRSKISYTHPGPPNCPMYQATCSNILSKPKIFSLPLGYLGDA